MLFMPRIRPHGPGRPNLGPRDAFITRPPVALGQAVREAADQLDMSYGSYITKVLAEAVGMPEYAPKPAKPHDQQEQELPLRTA